MDNTAAAPAEALRVAIDAALPAAKRVFADAEMEARQRTFGPSWRQMADLGRTLETPLGALLPPEANRFGFHFGVSGVMGVNPGMLAGQLLRISLQRGADGGVAWLQKVLSVSHADARLFTTVAGITVNERRELVPGFELMPYEVVQGTPLVGGVGRHIRAQPIPIDPGAVASLKVANVAWYVPMNYDMAADPLRAAELRMAGLVSALAALGGGPRQDLTWLVFDDEDLQLLVGGYRFAGENDLGVRHLIDMNEAGAFLAKFESAPLIPSHRKSLALALERIVLARTKRAMGDKALDGGIALEAIFGDPNAQEISYRLRVRAALLLGDSLEERKRIAQIVKSFYGIRSQVAHGRVSGSDVSHERQSQVIEDALGLCAMAIRKVVELGRIPDWSNVELGANP